MASRCRSGSRARATFMSRDRSTWLAMSRPSGPAIDSASSSGTVSRRRERRWSIARRRAMVRTHASRLRDESNRLRNRHTSTNTTWTTSSMSASGTLPRR
jgi:hypothetical protein